MAQYTQKDYDSLCGFMNDPNYFNGKRVQPDSQKYKDLVKMCEDAGYPFIRTMVNGGYSIEPKSASYRAKKSALLKQIDVCEDLITYTRYFIAQKCINDSLVCPTSVVDPITNIERPLRGTDVIPKCQEWACTLQQMMDQNERYRQMVLSDQFTGISGSSAHRPFTENDFDELRQHIQKFCKRQTGQLSDLVFGISTETQPKLRQTSPKKDSTSWLRRLFE